MHLAELRGPVAQSGLCSGPLIRRTGVQIPPGPLGALPGSTVQVMTMGRYRNIPLKDGTVVRENKVGTTADTPYYPRDINHAVCRRLFGTEYVPDFRGEGTSGANV